MKCIQCNTDNTLRDRTDNQGKCKNCNHPFVFEPTSVADYRFKKVTDGFFAKAISDISAENTLFFTPKQLLYLFDKRLKNRLSHSGLLTAYFLLNIFSVLFTGAILGNLIGAVSLIIGPFLLNICFIAFFFKATKSNENSYQERKSSAKTLQIIGGGILIVGILLSIAVFNSFIGFLISAGLGLLSIYLGTRRIANQADLSRSLMLAQSQVNEWLTRWIQVNGAVTKMLPSPREENITAQVSPEVSAYSFDRVVVCDSAAIAQLLIANNFHFENNCAVLSINRYPQSIFSTVLEMLRRNSELKVYALHDASPRGVGLVHHLRSSPNWFQNSNVTIYDIGLLPRQIFRSRTMFVCNSEESAQQAKQMQQEVRQDLSTEELKWLEIGHFVELESFTPKRLLQVVMQGIAKSRDPNSADSLVVIDSGDSDVYVFASDSFG